ncbi:MAG: Gfo/Idh/MocA family oxidoreductase [Pirellulales bacterium]|nr:Gfo/Idh/MocA family oxidoreductase [Pirellulales bacterium]
MADSKIVRRKFFGKLGAGALGAAAVGLAGAGCSAEPEAASGKWEPVSDRKLRVGIVGYGSCQFGAAFGFQDHPNVQIVAVSDLIAERRRGLMKACRCEKSYESLEEMVKDDSIEAIFTATDAPNHAKHSIEILKHGKHSATAVPAAFGSIEDAEKLLETVRQTGLKYAMFETSYFRPDCCAMRAVYEAGGFGKLVYSEGEYYHHCARPRESYKGWRVGMPPLWYATHSTAYYVGVSGGQFTMASCFGRRGTLPHFLPENNPYQNPFDSEIALFDTTEGGVSRMAVCWGARIQAVEQGRVFGERGSMSGMDYQAGLLKKLPDLSQPPLPPGVPAGGHGGSHGRLTDDFVTAILTNRRPAVDVYAALAMTVPGIIAHRSAQKDGLRIPVPQYPRPA